MGIKVDKSAWSEESKRSSAYSPLASNYKDITYQCFKCGRKAVYTAQEQKEAFEDRKCYIWQRRILCGKCYKKLKSLKSKIEKYEALWVKETEDSKKKAAYLEDWLTAINELPLYGKPKNEAMSKKLAKLINSDA